MDRFKFTIQLSMDTNQQEESLEFEIHNNEFNLSDGDKLADFIINTLPEMLKQAGIEFTGD